MPPDSLVCQRFGLLLAAYAGVEFLLNWLSHDHFSDLILASRAWASAMTRTIEAAMPASPRGWVLVTLGATGQAISTAGGLPAGLTSSTLIRSPLGVIWPAANSMRDDVDTAGSIQSRSRFAP